MAPLAFAHRGRQERAYFLGRNLVPSAARLRRAECGIRGDLEHARWRPQPERTEELHAKPLSEAFQKELSAER